jgi:hypothetical protein
MGRNDSKIFRFSRNEVKEILGLELDDDFDYSMKCGGCNWETHVVYVFAKSESDARELVKNEVFMCAECFLDFLSEMQNGR